MRYDLRCVLVAACAAISLAGCTSTEETLAPRPADTPGAAETIFPSSTGTRVEGAGSSLRFTPVIGAPVSAISPLSKQLAAEAKKRGITVYGSAEPGGDYILKGYLSAESDGTRTTIFFVWDVIDPTGIRLHRIQGQEVVPGKADDAWAIVPPEAMARIATRTFDEYEAWLSTRKR